jgi:hypothetical protein
MISGVVHVAHIHIVLGTGQQSGYAIIQSGYATAQIPNRAIRDSDKRGVVKVAAHCTRLGNCTAGLPGRISQA